MSPRWQYAVEVRREDRSPVERVPVSVDWEPLREWVRLEALRRGAPVPVALGLECDLTPVWDEARGAPYLNSVRARTGPTCVGHLTLDVGREYFGDAAKAAITVLVEAETLAEGDSVAFAPMAYPMRESETPPQTKGRFSIRPTLPSLPVERVSFPRGATYTQAPGALSGSEMPVFIPTPVLGEIRELARAAGESETGGLLVGHVRRDEQDDDLFLEVTAQLPARFTPATSTRLTFTAETWSELGAALAERRRSEIALGWYHSHPVHAWCAKCAPERRDVCGLRNGFLSAEDRLLHRAVFPRAYSLALLVNQLTPHESTLSLFGWQRGLLTARGHHQVAEPSPLASHSDASTGEAHGLRR